MNKFSSVYTNGKQIDEEKYNTIHYLYKQNYSISKIMQYTKLCRNTIKKYLQMNTYVTANRGNPHLLALCNNNKLGQSINQIFEKTIINNRLLARRLGLQNNIQISPWNLGKIRKRLGFSYRRLAILNARRNLPQN